MFPIVSGIVPVKALPVKHKVVSPCRFTIASGIVPFKPLFRKPKSVSADSLSICDRRIRVPIAARNTGVPINLVRIGVRNQRNKRCCR